jgi:Uma2 family endonuclease
MRTDIKLTYQEYCALPETGPRYQLIEGDLIMSPAPRFRHQKISGRMYHALQTFLDSNNLGVLSYAPTDVVLSDENVVQPDILFVSNKRLNIIRDEGVFGAPDICVEILSGHHREIDLNVKRLLYARHGVIEYWIVDPDANTLQQYRLQEDATKPLRIFGEKEILQTAILAGFELNLELVFAK